MVDLSSSLKKRFAAMNNKKETPQQGTVNGTAFVDSGGSVSVTIDGSSMQTPATTTVEVKTGDRVICEIKNHKVIITGNTTAPADQTRPDLELLAEEVEELEEYIDEMEGIYIVSIEPQWCLATARSLQEGQTFEDIQATGYDWEFELPEMPETGLYFYWTRNLITYSDGSTSSTEPVFDIVAQVGYEAEKAATDASETIEDLEGHFWTDANGVNVSETEDSLATGASMSFRSNVAYLRANGGLVSRWANSALNFYDGRYGESDASLANSLLASYGRNGVTLYGQNGNDSSNVRMASFTGSGVTFWDPSDVSNSGTVSQRYEAIFAPTGISFNPEIPFTIGNNNSFIKWVYENGTWKIKIQADELTFTPSAATTYATTSELNAVSSTASAASTAASNAQSTANSASTAASNAQSTANSASTAASNAAKTATNYITDFGSYGVKVFSANNSNNYVTLDGTSLCVYCEGVKYSEFGSTITLGRTTLTYHNVRIDPSDGLKLYKGSTFIGQVSISPYDTTAAMFAGSNSMTSITINSSEIGFYSNGSTKMVVKSGYTYVGYDLYLDNETAIRAYKYGSTSSVMNLLNLSSGNNCVINYTSWYDQLTNTWTNIYGNSIRLIYRDKCYMGTTTSSTTAITSDERYKKNIENLPDLYDDFILKLKPKTFQWITDKDESKIEGYVIDQDDVDVHCGLIAQEVMSLYDSFGISWRDHAVIDVDPGCEEINLKEHYRLNYLEFIPMLIHLCQTQQKEIDVLKDIVM